MYLFWIGKWCIIWLLKLPSLANDWYLFIASLPTNHRLTEVHRLANDRLANDRLAKDLLWLTPLIAKRITWSAIRLTGVIFISASSLVQWLTIKFASLILFTAKLNRTFILFSNHNKLLAFLAVLANTAIRARVTLTIFTATAWATAIFNSVSPWLAITLNYLSFVTLDLFARAWAITATFFFLNLYFVTWVVSGR